jgi:hypothetical protein
MGSITHNATTLADQIEKFIETPSSVPSDHATRVRLRDIGRKLSISMEAPWDSVHRIINTVWFTSLRAISLAF